MKNARKLSLQTHILWRWVEIDVSHHSLKVLAISWGRNIFKQQLMLKWDGFKRLKLSVPFAFSNNLSREISFCIQIENLKFILAKKFTFCLSHTSKTNHIKVEWLINFVVVVGYVETNDDLQKEHIESVRYLCRHKSLERKEIRQKSCLTFKSTTNEKLKWDLKWAITAASLGVLFLLKNAQQQLFICLLAIHYIKMMTQKNSHVCIQFLLDLDEMREVHLAEMMKTIHS